MVWLKHILTSSSAVFEESIFPAHILLYTPKIVCHLFYYSGKVKLEQSNRMLTVSESVKPKWISFILCDGAGKKPKFWVEAIVMSCPSPHQDSSSAFSTLHWGWNPDFETELSQSGHSGHFIFPLIFLKPEHMCAQLCLTLCNSRDCSWPGSCVHGISKARILEWVSISSSRRSSWPRDRTWASCIGRRLLCRRVTREAPARMTRNSWFFHVEKE